MIKSNFAYGMVPEDLLVLGAIKAGIEEIRNNLWLLDYCYNWIAQDDLTNRYYGDKEKQAAKDWFIRNEINVSMSTRVDDIKLPLVTVELVSRNEDYATLGDINYDTSEEIASKEIVKQPQIILGPITPNYDKATGIVTLPANTNTLFIFENQVLVDSVNNVGYAISRILSNTTFEIEADKNPNFTNSYIAPIDDLLVVSLESVLSKDTYSIKCFANESRYLMYLTALIRFICYRYKQVFFEKRGLDRQVLSMQGPYNASAIKGPESQELIFGQNIQLIGYVREYWPKMIDSKIQGMVFSGLKYIGGSVSPVSIYPELKNQGWWQQDDPLDGYEIPLVLPPSDKTIL